MSVRQIAAPNPAVAPVTKAILDILSPIKALILTSYYHTSTEMHNYLKRYFKIRNKIRLHTMQPS